MNKTQPTRGFRTRRSDTPINGKPAQAPKQRVPTGAELMKIMNWTPAELAYFNSLGKGYDPDHDIVEAPPIIATQEQADRVQRMNADIRQRQAENQKFAAAAKELFETDENWTPAPSIIGAGPTRSE